MTQVVGRWFDSIQMLSRYFISGSHNLSIQVTLVLTNESWSVSLTNRSSHIFMNISSRIKQNVSLSFSHLIYLKIFLISRFHHCWCQTLFVKFFADFISPSHVLVASVNFGQSFVLVWRNLAINFLKSLHPHSRLFHIPRRCWIFLTIRSF